MPFKLFFASLSFAFLSSSALATGGESIDSLDGLVQNRHTLKTEIPGQDHWYSNPRLIGGIKSSNSLGRLSTMGQTLRSREEIFFGARTPSGWGISVMASAIYGSSGSQRSANGSSRTSALKGRRNSALRTETDSTPPSPADTNGYGDFSPNRTGVQDPSLSVTHPIYDWGSVSLSGVFRETFPVSDYSLSNHTWQQGYYSILSMRLPNRFNLANTLMFHYFSRDTYTPPLDTTMSAGYMTSISRRFNKWFRSGLGQRIQVDVHQYGPVGNSIEIFTTADFILAPGIFAGPRIHFPVASQNAVFSDAPTTPAIGNIQAEIYVQAAL